MEQTVELLSLHITTPVFGESSQDLWFALKKPVMRKVFPCNDAIMLMESFLQQSPQDLRNCISFHAKSPTGPLDPRKTLKILCVAALKVMCRIYAFIATLSNGWDIFLTDYICFSSLFTNYTFLIIRSTGLDLQHWCKLYIQHINSYAIAVTQVQHLYMLNERRQFMPWFNPT